MRLDVSAKLRRIKVPVLCLQATHDRLLSAQARQRLLNGVPQAVVAQVDGPHLLLQTAPGACARAVIGFLGGL